MCVCIYMYKRTHVCIHMYTHTEIQLAEFYICTYTHMCTYIHTYVGIRIKAIHMKVEGIGKVQGKLDGRSYKDGRKWWYNPISIKSIYKIRWLLIWMTQIIFTILYILLLSCEQKYTCKIIFSKYVENYTYDEYRNLSKYKSNLL